jgi:hypothetical protein
MANNISHHNIKVLHKFNDDEFVGVYAKLNSYTGIVHESACYGWSKGTKNFFVYTIGDGHISKIGTCSREVMG